MEEQIDFKHLQGLDGTGVSAVWELRTWYGGPGEWEWNLIRGAGSWSLGLV